ncbi:helix-turn-helix transcriptional regulator [Bacillus velezensis]|uniref:helix-turn-helix domain-containing protein n=1 Tax=Bacillus velezensis TaxID=492670 RepID=UPI002E238410|nr:helix-turn-helix transcriptional regulator [Bacillus velezensis]
MEVFITFKVGKCRIPELCKKRGISLSQLAAMVGVSKTQMSDYVSLRNLPSIERTYNIAMMLGCAPEDLYNWIEVSDSNTEG